jgi:hypothetical protein
MKQTILKYSSLLALLGSPLISSQTYAAECATGASPDDSCEIEVSNTTYTLTGDINTNTTDNIIDFGAGANSNTLNFIGNITSEGLDARAFSFSDNDGNTLTMTGSIITEGNGANGIKLFPGVTNANINMTGNITTSGTAAYGIGMIESDSNTTTLTGDITTTGGFNVVTSYSAYGIGLENSDSNTTTMIGNISTIGYDADGIVLSASDFNTTILSGGITTTGNFADGITLLRGSDSNTTTMTGNITTSGLSADGIQLDSSDSNIVNMTGNIITSGLLSYGMYVSESDSNTINMTGNIITSGLGAAGIGLENSDSNTVNWVGGMTSTNIGQHAILLNDSDSNTISMTGNINSTGLGSTGIWIETGSESNTINVTGDINVTGQNASGLYLRAGSDSNNITINGNIITSGTDGDSEPILLSNSDSNTFTLSGAVHSLGGDQAISVNSTSQSNTFTFKRGASFIGGLENNGGTTNKLIFDMGKASSYNLDTDGTTWTLEDPYKPIVSGSAKSMGVADIDNQAHILYRRMDPINDVLSERQRLYTEGQRPTGYYMDSYYGHDKRDEDYSEISGNAGGVTVGYVLENTQTPMEVLVNFEVSQDNYGSGLAKQITESNSLLAGLYLPAIAEDVMGGNLSAKVLVGMSDNDAKRTVLNNSLGTSTASEKVSGDYTSSYISAGAEWLTEFLKVERVSHELSVGADLVQAYNEDYTAGEYKVDSRDMTQIQSRVLYGMTYKNLAKTVDVNTRFGVSNQYMVAGDKQDYKINGTSVSYTGDDNSFYYTAGLGAKYYLADNTNLYVDTKYGQSSDDIQNLTVDFGFISRF